MRATSATLATLIIGAARVLLIDAAAMTVLHIPGPAEHAAVECSCTWNTLGSYWMKDLDCPYHTSAEHQE